MECNENDIRLYKELLNASKDYLCRALPPTVTKSDVERLCRLKLCDNQTKAGIILIYTEDDLSELEKKLQIAREQYPTNQVDNGSKCSHSNKQRKHHVNHNLRDTILSLFIAALFDFIFHNLFGIIRVAAKLLRSLIP